MQPETKSRISCRSAENNTELSDLEFEDNNKYVLANLRGVHPSRTGPDQTGSDRPGSKTERGACPGPRTGPDRSRTDLVSTQFCCFARLPEIWHGVAVPSGTAVPHTNLWHGQTMPISTAVLPVPASILIPKS